jgi:hypothetical protein
MISWCPEEHTKYSLHGAFRLDSAIETNRDTPADTPRFSPPTDAIYQRDFLPGRYALKRRSLQILNSRSL